ncbi:MAG: winged helix-turn-helix transcriptional regulator [Deltaproteobacteria bacterium]|nr:winged helix-turn-helix transcriptional regulator [Deltaproteobacteria bacterium]
MCLSNYGIVVVTGTTASRHLGVLISAGLMESCKDGRWVYYSLKFSGIEKG